MQDQLNVLKEMISTFLQDNREGKKKLMEWFLNSVMEEEARMQVLAGPYERSIERRAHRNGIRIRKLKTGNGELELRSHG